MADEAGNAVVTAVMGKMTKWDGTEALTFPNDVSIYVGDFEATLPYLVRDDKDKERLF
jgi:hypothetical protein|tara:strand:- start:219 stop:392 length:174 start_codon:yes stop_codon:yes gene_type:complete